MVDSLAPLPPVNQHVTRTQVTEKDPHHQNNQHKKKQQDREVTDEVAIEGLDNEGFTKDNNLPKQHHQQQPEHKFDIEV